MSLSLPNDLFVYLNSQEHYRHLHKKIRKAFFENPSVSDAEILGSMKTIHFARFDV